MLSEANYLELQKYTEPHAPSRSEYERFIFLKEKNLIKIHHFSAVHLGSMGQFQAPDTWIITSAGQDALLEFEQERDKQTEQKRQQRFQNQVSIAQVLVPLITFILGLVVEHYAGLVGSLGRWIENFIH